MGYAPGDSSVSRIEDNFFQSFLTSHRPADLKQYRRDLLILDATPEGTFDDFGLGDRKITLGKYFINVSPAVSDKAVRQFG